MKNLLENYDLLFAMTVLTAIAILFKCICAIMYQILLKDAEQITSTKNKWMRSMQTKFEACYKLRIPVHNPSSFVKNHMAQYHFLGFSMKSLENTDIFCGLLVSGATILCIMCGIYYELPAQWIFIHSMTLVFFLLFLAIGELIFQVRHKRKLLQLQLINYFENTLQGKLENQYLHPEENAAYQQSYFEEETDNEADEKKEATQHSKAKNTAASTKESSTSSKSEIPDFEDAYGPVISADMQELIDSLLEESKISRELDKKKDKLMTAATTEKFRLVEEIMKEYL